MLKEGKISKANIAKEIKGYLFMLLGCIAYATSTSIFLAPNQIVAGGVSGLSVLINILNDKIPVGTMSIALNIPLLLIGLKVFGWQFIVRTLITTVSLGSITDLLAFFPLPTEEGVLASLYGGICQGIGIGLFVRYQFCGGGTELLGRMLARRIKRISIPICIGILDAIIIIFGAIVTKNPANMLYALIVVFGSTKVSEMVLVGVEKSKLCIIISDKGEEISAELLRRSPRGITMLDGKGMYTHQAHNVVLTCVKNYQLTQLKQIVKEVDERAFIIINDSAEVRGKGFKDLNDDNGNGN